MATFVFGKTTGATGNQGFIGSAFEDGGIFDIGNIWNYDTITGNGTSAVKLLDDNANYFEMKGKGYSFVGDVPVTGAVNTLTLADDGVKQISVTGLAGVDLPTLYFLSGEGVVADGEPFLFMAELFKGDDKVTMTAFDDVLVEGWNAGNDSIFGLAGNDVLFGDDGDDMLDGGKGADTMKGGKGVDTYIVDNLLDTVDETAGSGTDTVKSSVSFSLVAGDGQVLGGVVEDLVLSGSLNINGTGNAAVNKVTGNGKNNIIIGGDGGDTLDGGAGIDTLSYEGSALGVNVTLLGKTVSMPFGGDADGDLIVNFENLIGSDENDTLVGDGGKNTLDGGEGSDELTGAKGDDIYVVDSLGDIVTELVNEGKDTIRAALTFSIETLTNIENLTLDDEAHVADATGNAGKNIITGNEYANVLDGKGGPDTLIGGDDNDTYVVYSKSDKITELAGEGEDTVLISQDFLPDSKGNIVYSMTALKNVENLTYNHSLNVIATGNSLNNVIFTGGGIDKLNGGDGDDTLIGGGAADIYTGGKGADTFVFSSTDDAIITDFVQGLDKFDIAYLIAASPAMVGLSFTDLQIGGFVDFVSISTVSGQSSDSKSVNNVAVVVDRDGFGGNLESPAPLFTIEDFTGNLTGADFVIV